MRKKLLLAFLATVCMLLNNFSATAQSCAPFNHGVASGDPLTDRIIIWTRVTPANKRPVTVHWRMAKDTGMAQVVQSGSFITKDSIDYTVKVDVKGLTPDTYYFYDFETDGKYSARGRTHTMPATGTATQRFAVTSCQNWEDGFFNAYNRIAARNDISAVIFLGDYIYEYKSGEFSSNIPGRVNDPLNECKTLKDYRTRYALYRTDSNLLKCHQLYPWMIVWDDHEFANDAYKNGAENHQPGSEGNWEIRKANAMEAWNEWLPVRIPEYKPNGESVIFRKISVGGLINFYLLDSRIFARTKQLSILDANFNDTTRCLLGPLQLNTLLDDMDNSTAKWNIICQQVMVAPLEAFGVPVNTDAWDGYPAERNRLIKGLKDRDIDNAVVLTGDFHTAWGNDIPTSNYNWLTGTGAAAVEFVTTSVTSQNFSLPIPEFLIQGLNPHVQYVDISHHGYLLLDVKPDRTTGEWYNVKTVTEPSQIENLSGVYYVNGSKKHLVQASNATVSIPVPAPLPPGCSSASNIIASTIHPEKMVSGLAIADVYPNPFINQLTIDCTAFNDMAATLTVTDMQGRILIKKAIMINKGANQVTLNTDQLPAGSYILSIRSNNGIAEHKLIIKGI